MRKLIRALKLCAAAHGYEGYVSKEDSQIYILTCNIPIAEDVESIVTGFTGNAKAVEADFNHGWITVFLNECKILPKDKIDWMVIQMALPYGTII